jgi:hypothetical protein
MPSVIYGLRDYRVTRMERLESLKSLSTSDHEFRSLKLQEDAAILFRTLMWDAARFQVRGDHAIHRTVHASEAPGEVVPNATEDSLNVLIEPTLDEACRTVPPVLDRTPTLIYFVA